ncbi:MAG: hypothetical protein JO140_04690, partial [Candidatus Eremiobacteraeota bacterium]|nr:hypothetical protein [Candidatus Eremiobacteraeota bacterium]
MNAAALGARLRALPPRMRIIVAASALAVAALAALGSFATRDGRVPLFATPLRADQLAEVEARLAASGTP